MNINYNIIFKFFIPYLFIALISYILVSILYFISPKDAVLYKNYNNNELEYKRYNINNLFKENKIQKQIIKKTSTKQEYQILSNIKLLAIYSMNDNSGYIIMQENNKQDTIILSKDEKFKDYVLTKVFATYAVFTKNGKEYKLSIKGDKKDIKYDIVSQNDNVKTTKSITIEDNQIIIKRELIDDYIKNFDNIWKDISISDVRDKKGIIGFKVNRIKKNTPFAKIGLKKDDIIKSINNIKLKSYNDAFKIYKKINKIKNLNIIVLRDNIETEIYYEIK